MRHARKLGYALALAWPLLLAHWDAILVSMLMASILMMLLAACWLVGNGVELSFAALWRLWRKG